MTGWMWLLATVIGVAILGAAIYYGRRQVQSYERKPGAVRESERATKKLYEDEERTTREG